MRNKQKRAYLAIVLAVLCFATTNEAEETGTKPLPNVLNFKFIASHPHDEKAFTQGLVIRDGFLYEGTGQYGTSSLRQVDVKTGKILKKIDMPKKFFGEGIEIVGDRIYQLTWTSGYCFVFNKDNFELVETFRYPGEGWGLAYDGERLIMSDGSATLRFIDPKTFKQKGKVQVVELDPKTKKSILVQKLNELEYVRGEIWANVWQSNEIVRIDPTSGKVVGRIDCSAFIPDKLKRELTGPIGQRDRVLNGIAFDRATDSVYLTGKYWPVLYEIKIVDMP